MAWRGYKIFKKLLFLRKKHKNGPKCIVYIYILILVTYNQYQNEMLNVKKAVSPLPYSRFVSLPQLLKTLDSYNDTMVVQINKNPDFVFKKGLWIGYRTSSMSGWLDSTIPHLPFKNFYLFKETGSGIDTSLLDHYDQYFSSYFSDTYKGTCLAKQKDIPSKYLTPLKKITTQQLVQRFNSQVPTVLLDVRIPEEAMDKPVTSLPSNVQYVNMPISDDHLSESFLNLSKNLNSQSQIITMCGSGYRCQIAYSVLRHLCDPNIDLMSCPTPITKINTLKL